MEKQLKTRRKKDIQCDVSVQEVDTAVLTFQSC